MVRLHHSLHWSLFGSPHTRGDGPNGAEVKPLHPRFSPHAWGWSGVSTCFVDASTVLPTRVGMVRQIAERFKVSRSSPHTRGDGPAEFVPYDGIYQFSPHAWGWSDANASAKQCFPVLPTRVGMVRSANWPVCGAARSPHTRGDGPLGLSTGRKPSRFSPHAWGWSAFPLKVGKPKAVLPTRVGMVREEAHPSCLKQGSPHTRGDGPLLLDGEATSRVFSPHAWGWSDEREWFAESGMVLPTRVGMVRIPPLPLIGATSSPHTRGDGPMPTATGIWLAEFSPHAWGWSAIRFRVGSAAPVLPTRVGMVRLHRKAPPFVERSPHTRGDGPLSSKHRRQTQKFSPHAWGWSVGGPRGPPQRRVLPTRVGMVRTRGQPRAMSRSSPHTRGDGPRRIEEGEPVAEFSPHAWGWSAKQGWCARR